MTIYLTQMKQDIEMQDYLEELLENVDYLDQELDCEERLDEVAEV